MMSNVNTLAHRFGPLIYKYLEISAMLRERDQLQHPKAYFAATFLASKTSKIQYILDVIPITILTDEFIASFKVKPNKKLTADTHITPPVSINTY